MSSPLLEEDVSSFIDSNLSSRSPVGVLSYSLPLLDSSDSEKLREKEGKLAIQSK